MVQAGITLIMQCDEIHQVWQENSLPMLALLTSPRGPLRSVSHSWCPKAELALLHSTS